MAASKHPPIILTTVQKSSLSLLMGNIITEAYRRAGIEATIQYVPGKRALKLSSTGITDGEVSRVFSIGEKFKTLIRVPVPLLSMKGRIFVNTPDIHIQSKEDLSDYRIGVLRGVVYSEKIVKGLDFIYANSMNQLFEMLVRNRVDMVILTEVSGQLEKNRSFARFNIRMLDITLVDIPIFHYLHEKNKQLIPVIEPILQDMLDSGEISAMKEAFIIAPAASQN